MNMILAVGMPSTAFLFRVCARAREESPHSRWTRPFATRPRSSVAVEGVGGPRVRVRAKDELGLSPELGSEKQARASRR